MAALLAMTELLVEGGLLAISVLLPQMEKAAPFLEEAWRQGVLVDFDLEWGYTRPTDSFHYHDTARIIARRGPAPISDMHFGDDLARRILGLRPAPAHAADDDREDTPCSVFQEAIESGWSMAQARDQATQGRGPPRAAGLNRAVALVASGSLVLHCRGAETRDASTPLLEVVQQHANGRLPFFQNAAAKNRAMLAQDDPPSAHASWVAKCEDVFKDLVGDAATTGGTSGGGVYLAREPCKIGTSEGDCAGRAGRQSKENAVLVDYTAPAGTAASERLITSEAIESLCTIAVGGLLPGSAMYGGPRTNSGLCANPSAGGESLSASLSRSLSLSLSLLSLSRSLSLCSLELSLSRQWCCCFP
jgi:hypothetical protein